MAEPTPRGIQATLFDYFQDTEYFDLQEANELLLEHQQRDINAESIRARIYEGIEKGLFERVGKGLYTVTRKDEQGRENTCLLINGDGRDLSMFPDNSVDALITDHPYQLTNSLKGRNRNFADYELFQYNEEDFKSKLRVLKPGRFLVEFLPEENGDNFQYLYQVKEMARKAGFEYFAKVPWKKGNFVANTGRKSKNTEDICFFTKGRARDLRPDAQKDKAEPGIQHFMSGAAGMLPTVFDVAPPSRKEKIHQAEKPVELLEQILRFITKEDELVLDQFAGSGSVGEAALNTHRNSILIEKNTESFDKLRTRIEALGNVDIYTPLQRETVNVAIDALEAVHDGPEAVISFANYQNKHGLTLPEAFAGLSSLMYSPQTPEQETEQEALDASAKAIEYVQLQLDQLKHGTPLKLIESQIEPMVAPAAPKVLECSSRGDRRFSSLFALVTIKGKEKSIEEWYQNAKRTADGKKAGKGKPFDHIICPYTGDKLPASEASNLFKGLWITYLSKNPDLVTYATGFDEFHDMFRGKNTVNCQADVIAAYVKDSVAFISDTKQSFWYQNMARKLKPALSEQIQAASEKKEAVSKKQLPCDRNTGIRS